MADVMEGTASSIGASQVPDLGWHPPGSTPKEPGWFAIAGNPNEQAYWDGNRWTGERHWVGGIGWADGPGGAAQRVHVTDHRMSANPYAVHASATRTSGVTLSLGALLLMVSGIALMYGSIGAWIHASGLGDLRLSVVGTDPSISSLIGVNGYVTFIGGVVLLVFGGLSMMSDELLLQWMTALVAFVTLVFAVFDMVRIVQKLTEAPVLIHSNVSVGWGLICVLSAAVLAMLVSLGRILQR